MKLKLLSENDLSILKDKWIKSLKTTDHPVFLTEYLQIFNLILATGCWDELHKCLNKPTYICIVDKHDEVWAIIQIVQTKNGSAVWIKMLDIYLSPKIETEPDNEINTKKRLEVFGSALIGIFKLTSQIGRADTVKVYGRTDALITFLRGMHDTFSVLTSLGTISGIEIAIEGRWLVFHALEGPIN